MKKLFLVLLFFVWVLPVHALQIRATVGDEVITDADIKNRQKLLNALFQFSMPEDKVLDSLINEKVKQLTAAKENIVLTETQIADGIAYLEQQNGMEKGALMAFVKENNLSQASLLSQVIADLSWLNYVGGKQEKQPKVTDKEISDKLEEMRKQMMEGGFLIAEIFIPFDKDQEAAKTQAESLFNRIVAGESFTDLAVQYSKGKTASQMGDLGWVKPGEMEDAIDQVLPHMQVGQLSRPIKGKKGYTLILMREIQPALDSDMQELWQVVQLVLPREKYLEKKRSLEAASKSCMTFTQYAQDNGVEGSHSGAMPEMLAERIPDDLKGLLIDREIGELVGPVDMQKYAVFVMKCGVRMASILPDKETVKQQLLMQKMEKTAEEMLVQARKKTLVEVK